MRKPDPTEEALAQLRAMRECGEITDLAPYLRHKSSAVIARAAEMAQETALTPHLVDAFRRVFPNAAKRDPGCRALTSLATTLARLDSGAAEVYSLGVTYHQWEASWGPPVDTAAPLRAVCAMALVSMGDPDALLACCELLSDAASDARIGAVRALGASGRHEAELLLRYKAREGDDKPEVTSETFSALLNLGPRLRSINYVAGFLSCEDAEVEQAAALALGESRQPEAVQLLKDAFNRNNSHSKAGALLWALALSRDPNATEFCFDQLENGHIQALDALSLYKAHDEWRDKVRAVLDRRKDVRWEAVWLSKWST